MQSELASSEIRAMFDVAHRYAAGSSSVHELNGAISCARTWAKAAHANSAVLDLLDDWSHMLNRRWNEWGLEKNPISEEQFRAWLQEQLVRSNHAG